MKQYTTLFMTIFLTVNISAYVEPEYYHGIPLKFYSETINKTDVYNQLDSINKSYLEWVGYIKFFEDTNSRALGQYWWFTKGIDIFDCDPNCSPYVLPHELAHHCQYRRGDNRFNGLNHNGHFYECLEEIE